MRRLRRHFPAAKRRSAKGLLFSAGSCAALLLAAAAAAAADDPRDWLTRADQALATRNYEGVFVHEHAGETETLRVIHRVGSDGVSERLLSMDGSGREFIRRGGQLTCYLPDQRTVLVEKNSGAGLLLGDLPRIDATSAGQYDVRELSRSRVSGRTARVIEIMPMDELRYGYRLWIDEATAMPLKTQLRTVRGAVLEQIVFTSLVLPARIADSELEPATDARHYRWVQHLADTADAPGLPVSWQAGALPPGFRMTVIARQVLSGGPVEHLVFSDGLASVSVFVEIGRSAGAEQVSSDAATLGSSSAYSTVVQGYRVTAVGEVPPDTVRAIAQSIRAAQPVPSLAESFAGFGPAPPGLRAESSRVLDSTAGENSFDANADPNDRGLGGARTTFGTAGDLGPGAGIAGRSAGPSGVGGAAHRR